MWIIPELLQLQLIMKKGENELNEVAQLITSLGFPIVMCAALCWYVYNVQTKLTDIVNENTNAIKELIMKIDFLGKEKNDDGK